MWLINLLIFLNNIKKIQNNFLITLISSKIFIKNNLPKLENKNKLMIAAYKSTWISNLIKVKK